MFVWQTIHPQSVENPTLRTPVATENRTSSSFVYLVAVHRLINSLNKYFILLSRHIERAPFESRTAIVYVQVLLFFGYSSLIVRLTFRAIVIDVIVVFPAATARSIHTYRDMGARYRRLTPQHTSRIVDVRISPKPPSKDLL